MSIVDHIIDELLDISQQEINVVHREIHRIRKRDWEDLSSVQDGWEEKRNKGGNKMNKGEEVK